MIDSKHNRSKLWLVTGCWLAGLTVILGAFGAHGLEGHLENAVEDPVKNMKNWDTASRYMMYHSLGIITSGLAISVFGSKTVFNLAATSFVVGIILFSGLLYTLALTDIKILGAIVPLGGLAMIFGWLFLGIGFMGTGKADAESNESVSTEPKDG